MSLWQKPSVWIALFFISFNAGAGALATAGAWDYLGIEADPASDIDDRAKKLESADPGQGSGETLFGLYNSLAGPLETLFDFIFPGGAMLKRVGVPPWLVHFTFTPLAIVPTIDIASYFRSG